MIKSIYWFYKRRIKSPVKNGELVLEIGSGDKPHWRTDVCIDRYPHDNLQRSLGDILVDDNKSFIIADAGYLPFKDNTFDFIIASHVLEHIENLGLTMKEISRVGKSGYIEVPYGFLDMIRPFESHLWFCDLDNDCLIFRRRPKDSDPLLLKLGDIFFANISLQKDLSKFFIMYEWKGELKYIINNLDEKDKYFYKEIENKDDSRQGNIKRYLMIYGYGFMYKFMCKLFYKEKFYNRFEK